MTQSEAEKTAGESIASSPATTPLGKRKIQMSNRRQDVISLLAARTSATRERLEWMSTEELEEALSKNLLARREAQNNPEIIATQAATQRRLDEINEQRLWDRFFFKHPEITDIVANRKFLFNYALSLTEDGVVRFEHLDEAAQLPGLVRQKIKQPLTAANLKQDEENLRQFCRTNSLEPSIAVLNLLRSEYGAGFDSGQIDRALQSGLIQLGQASAKILQEAAQERQDYLVNQAGPGELRQIARQETEQRSIQFQREETERH